MQTDPKYAYYLSMEFLQGRALLNAVENLDIDKEVRAALAKVCFNTVRFHVFDEVVIAVCVCVC